MPKLLHVVASPMGERSYSTRVAQAFADAWADSHPGGEVETLDLWRAELPEFDLTAAAGKFKTARGLDKTPAEAAGWARIEAVTEHFKAADAWVVSTGMWNFGVPYKLKHYLDVIVQPRLTVDVGPGGYTGLVTGRPLQLILARGGAYPEGSPMDFQLPWLKAIFGFIGIDDLRTLLVEPTADGARADELLAAAKLAAADAARSM